MPSKKTAPKTNMPRKAEENRRKRILVVDHDKVRPNSASWNFLKSRSGRCGRDCITVVQGTGDDSVPPMIRISEEACPVCLTSASKCPENAVKVVNLPSNLTTNTTHRYGPNSFKLHGLPTPKPGNVVGILGCNGIGKSTAMNILSGDIKPNLGFVGSPSSKPTWEDIVRYYRGSDLQNYFQRLVDGKLRCVVKPQLEVSYTKQFKDKTVEVALMEHHQRGDLQRLVNKLGLAHLLERKVRMLSGGELQRFAVCICAISDADVYLFDEPTSFLDVKQRIAVAEVIRGLVSSETYRTPDGHKAEALQMAGSTYVLVVEHDLTILDYVSDYVCCLYGEPGVYGVITQRSSTANGINQFIAGYIKNENVRFRAEPLDFQMPAGENPCMSEHSASGEYRYPAMSKTAGSNFDLRTEAGVVRDGEVIGILGQNGSGKTSFMSMLASYFDVQQGPPKSTKKIASYKRQHFTRNLRKYRGTVEQYLEDHMQWGLSNRLFRLLVMKPMQINKLKDLPVHSLSGGEMQRLAICVCLGHPAQLYLMDEPSAGLDCEQRLIIASVIKRWVVSQMSTAFIVEHDMVMASALYSRVIVFDGTPGVKCHANQPLEHCKGFNAFLRQLNVTIYHSNFSNRPRINKPGSRHDREQKASGNYLSLRASKSLEDKEWSVITQQDQTLQPSAVDTNSFAS